MFCDIGSRAELEVVFQEGIILSSAITVDLSVLLLVLDSV